MAFTKDNIKNISLEDIIKWCKENNQIDWLKKAAATTVERKIYPTITTVDAEGKEHTKQDKKQEPIKVEKVKISYVQLKFAFIKEFFPELTGEKKDTATMWDIIAAL